MTQFFMSRLYNQDSPDGGGGAPANEDDGGSTNDSESMIKQAVAEATKSLSANRDQILAEKRQLKERLDELSGTVESLGGPEGIKSLAEMRQRLEKDEMGKLLANGEYEDWYEKRTAALRGDYEQKLEATEQRARELEQEREQALTRLNDKVFEIEMLSACADTGVLDSARVDALNRARGVFTFDPQHNKLVIKDQDGVVLLGKDGKTPKGPSEWLEEQKSDARHWWPGSAGVGAKGSLGGDAGDPSADAEQMGRMSMEDYKKTREKRGMKTGFDTGIPF